MRPAFSVKENSHSLFLCDLCVLCGEKKNQKKFTSMSNSGFVIRLNSVKGAGIHKKQCPAPIINPI